MFITNPDEPARGFVTGPGNSPARTNALRAGTGPNRRAVNARLTARCPLAGVYAQADLPLLAPKGGALAIEQNLSPNGEPKAGTVKEVVKSIVLIKSVGKVNLYEVHTNLGTRQMLAASEEAVHALIEEGS
ncbi:MAG TPA: hypothetical protein VGD81_02355 [Opitutaceae bacterium]